MNSRPRGHRGGRFRAMHQASQRFSLIIFQLHRIIKAPGAVAK
jgi:hypothetical protein